MYTYKETIAFNIYIIPVIDVFYASMKIPNQ